MRQVRLPWSVWTSTLACVGLAFGLSGCGCRTAEPAKPSRPTVKIDPAKPEDTLYQQLRAGALQIAGVIETLDAAVVKLDEVNPGKDTDFRTALQELKESIDAAGAELADHIEEPNRERLGKVFPEYDEKRIRAIAAANDALHEVSEASGIASTLASEKKNSVLNDVADLLDLAIEDLRGSIQALGGKVEQEGP